MVVADEIRRRRSPRSEDRGRIEANNCRNKLCVMLSGSPRSEDRGRIEAPAVVTLIQALAVLHGPKTVAALKHHLNHTPAELGCGSPRSEDRGRIEAFYRKERSW